MGGGTLLFGDTGKGKPLMKCQHIVGQAALTSALCDSGKALVSLQTLRQSDETSN